MSQTYLILFSLLVLGAVSPQLVQGSQECDEEMSQALKGCERPGVDLKAAQESIDGKGNILTANKSTQEFVTCVAEKMKFIVNGEMSEHRSQCCASKDEETYQRFRAACNDEVKKAEPYAKGPVMVSCVSKAKVSS